MNSIAIKFPRPISTHHLRHVIQLSRRPIYIATELNAKKKTTKSDKTAAQVAQTKEEIEGMIARKQESDEDNILNTRAYLGKPLPGDVSWLPPNTKVTRIPVDTAVHPSELAMEQKLAANPYSLKVVNRNPRNLEQLFRQLKPLGYELDADQRRYWHQVQFERSGKYLAAKVIHWTGKTLVEASSKEPTLTHRLNGPNDMDAATAVGSLLARRCLECGIHWVDGRNLTTHSTKEKAFVDSLIENGVSLEEPEHIFPRRLRDE